MLRGLGYFSKLDPGELRRRGERESSRELFRGAGLRGGPSLEGSPGGVGRERREEEEKDCEEYGHLTT